MKPSIQPSCSQVSNQENIALSQSIVFTAQGCINDRIDCNSVVNDAQTLLQSCLNTTLNQINTNFKKNLSQSVHLAQKRDLTTQKSKFIELQTNNKNQERYEHISSSKKMIENDLLQLQTIYKKTEDLALKQREQRRQLKKLKKIYIQKVQQLMRQQQKHNCDTNQLIHQIQELKKYQENLLYQKRQIQTRMKQLEAQVEKTKQQIDNFQEEKLELLRRIEILQINYDLQIKNQDNQKQDSEKTQTTDRIHNIIHQNSQLESINYELNTINEMIQKTDNQCLQNQQKYKKIISLLCIKNQYLQQREIVKVQQDQQKYRKAILKLNQAVINREKIIFNKNQTIKKLTYNIMRYSHYKSTQNKNESEDKNENDKIMGQTTDSCFGKSARTSLAQSIIINSNTDGFYFKDQQQDCQTADDCKALKQKISNLVKLNTIVGYEQAYLAIQKTVFDMIELFQLQKTKQSNLLKVLQDNLQIINTQFRIKANRNVHKIQKLMAYLQYLNQPTKHQQNNLPQNQLQNVYKNINSENTFRTNKDNSKP